MKQKKDVLFLCQFFYPEYISSAQLPFDTVMALKNAGFSVDALCGYPQEYLDGRDIPVRETVDVILYAYQGIRMWSRIAALRPETMESLPEHIRGLLLKEGEKDEG